MGLVRRGNSRFWYVQFQLNGVTFVRSTKTPDRKVAERLEAEWRAQAHLRQVLGVRERTALLDAVDRLIATKAGTPNHHNLLSSRKIVERHFRRRRWLDELTTDDLEKFKRDRVAQGVTVQTIKHQLNLVRAAIKLAGRSGKQIPSVQFPTCSVPKQRVRYLSVEEERRLLAELNPMRSGTGLRPYAERSDALKRSMQDAHDLVVLLLDTGARYSEIANIKWSQIDLQRGEIRLWRPKVQNEGIIMMTDRASAIFGARLAAGVGEFVFTNKRGAARGYRVQSIRKAIKRAGLADCKIHTLRHTVASRLIQNGMSVYEVKSILGHTDIRTTMMYAHLEQGAVGVKAKNVLEALNRGRRSVTDQTAWPPPPLEKVPSAGKTISDV